MPGVDESEELQTPAQRYAELLSRVEIFATLDRVSLARLAAQLEPVAVSSGEAVFREGDEPDGLYIVTRGQFGLYASSPETGQVRLASVLPGDTFGEMALLTDEPRSASAIAETEAEALCLERARFLRLLGQEPGVARALGAILSRRLRAARRTLQRAGLSVHPEGVAESVAEEAPGDTAEVQARLAAPAGEAAQAPAWRSRRPRPSTLGLVLGAGALLVGWVTPPPPGLSVEGWRALATLLAAVPLLALEALPDGIVALALAATWVVGGVATPRTALSGFATPTWAMMVSVLAVGAAVAATGLLYRLALWAVAHAWGGFLGQVAALGLAGLVVSPAVPNATARVALIAPAVSELVEALGYAPASRAAAGLAMATLAGFGQMVAVFLTSSSSALLVYAVLPEDARMGLNWIAWAVRAAPTHACLLLGLLGAVLWLYAPRRGEAPLVRSAAGEPYGLALQRALLGAPSRRELAALGVASTLLLGFVTQPLHGVDPAWLAVLSLAVLAAAGVLAAEDLRAVNWSFVLLFGILASMVEVFASVGLDRWLAGLATAAVGDLADHPLGFVAALTLLCYGVSFVLRWQAAAPLLTIALAPLASAGGIDPWVVAMVALVACNTFFLPYQSTIYLALYHGTGGRLFTHAQARPFALAYGVVTLAALCASVPFWRLLGLM